MEDKNIQLRKRIDFICELAMNGRLRLEDFYERWPEDANDDVFFRQIYLDIEDAVEHLPGYLLKKGIDINSWISSLQYFTLSLDRRLLHTKGTSKELLECRKSIAENSSLDLDSLERRIDEFFSEYE